MTVPTFFVKALHKLGILPALNLEAGINLLDQRLVIPVLGGQGFYNLDLSEPWMTRVLQGIQPFFKGHFIDIGVNLGQTLLKAHAVFGKINYIGFEPNPSCVHYVQELVRANKLTGYNIFPVGVSTETEVLKLKFFAADKSDSAASIVENYRPDQKEDHFVYVPVFDARSLRPFLPGATGAIVKIDVEGAEWEVVSGLEDWIRDFRPLILMEILPVYSAENRFRLERQERIEALLRSLGYKMARIRKKQPVLLEPLEAIGVHAVIEDSDYIMYPSELAESVLARFENPAVDTRA